MNQEEQNQEEQNIDFRQSMINIIRNAQADISRALKVLENKDKSRLETLHKL